MSCTCAPFIDHNIEEAHRLGMTTVGCCGDIHHTYGFHREATALPINDYSLVRSGKPANPNQACAGDFSMNTPWARKWLAWFVNQVKAGLMPGVVEIIGSLDGVNVLYWSQWGGWRAQQYTGTGHKTWCHISCDRAAGNLTSTNFFAGFTPDVVFTPVGLPKQFVPAFPGRTISLRSPRMRGSDVLRWQTQMAARGWRITRDGVFGPESAGVLVKFQKEKKLTVDGKLGPKSWAAAWTAKVTK